MSNCALCSSEFTFMNASVGKSIDDGSVCRTCFKKVTKLQPGINIKKYSVEDLKNILSGKKVERAVTENIEKPKVDSKMIFGIIKGIAGVYLIYLAIKYLFFS